uniref:Protein SHQ1 homolog n=1 Tax=Strigamia maritima TaxID=126957 RepID=T1J969_STRMM
MITPMFKVRQDNDYVIVVIEAKYANVSETEVYFNQYDFKFHSKPYYLRLTFPCQVKSVDECQYSQIATYDCETGTFIINIAKKNQGEVFEDLDFTTKLLAVPRKEEKTPNIEVLDSSTFNDEECEDVDWHIEQQITTEESLISQNCYGFANKKSGCLNKVLEEISDLIELKNPEHKTNDERAKERLGQQIQNFSDDHYLADLYDCDEIEEIVNYLPFWEKETTNIEFTEDEQFILKELPRREYLLSANELRFVGLGLVDLIYCYAYQHRTTFSETNVESGWTIRKLSPTLSWLEVHTSLKSTLVSLIQRSLIYPLYRNWSLSNKIIKDVQKIFSLGRKCILKCLLEIRNIFINCDSQHVLNELYITDYCVWIQKSQEIFIQDLAKSLLEVNICKSDVELDLEELEQAAKEVVAAEMANEKENSSDVKEICNNLEDLHLVNEKGSEGLPTIKEETAEEKEVSTDDDDVDDNSSDETSDSEASYYLDSDDSENEK